MKFSQWTPKASTSRFFLILGATISVAVAAVDNDNAVMSSLLEAISPSPTGWSHSAHHCSKWTGVNCSSSGRVTTISLANLSLMGTLPSNLASLSELTHFNLKGNRFSGPLPSFANLSFLQEIFLDYNNFTSVPSHCFQGLTSLMVLTMDQNRNLAQWDFPIELTGSPSLVNLSMVSCNVRGTLPDIFGSFPNLHGLTLSHNYLTGVLPPSFAESGMQKLMLDNQKTKLVGTINVVSNMTKLSQVWLSGNYFSGQIPDLSKLDTLFDLQLQDNQFTGVVPSSLISIRSLRSVSLKNNLLQGPQPLFPPYVTIVDVVGIDSYCRDTPGRCDRQVEVLLEVARDLGYPSVLAKNWRGNDVCKDWTYVGCDSQGNITKVNFHKRHLDGRISPAFANLTELHKLWLNNNNLTGPIPESLTLLPHLQILNVSYNNLSGTVPKFQSTVDLITAGNPLMGNYTSSLKHNNETLSNGTPPVMPGINLCIAADVTGGELNIVPVKAVKGNRREFKLQQLLQLG
ncbi:receptor-like kinase TMK4 [Humulus lupulus]|uniref:receptor-like kinase TMK4 n=1 Tax=Humulus lupulus TaxID=3486 RepID=UPI002B4171F4|nr:receptor-like kinase TMK4 [Humulus lupulus]